MPQLSKLLSTVPLFVLIATTQPVRAQSGILGKNLITNGDAESGQAGTSLTGVVTSIPAWTVAGGVNVIPYGLVGLIPLTDPAPPDHGFQYFVAAGGRSTTSTLTQVIDVSSGASDISGGNVKFTASAYLGSANGQNEPAQMAVAFQNAKGQTFNTITLGPLGFPSSGLSLQQQIGLVPSGTVQVTVTLSLNYGCENAAACFYSAADSLSLVLSNLSTSAASVLGTNLVVNGDAESGAGVPEPGYAPYVPGWSTSGGASVAPYGSPNFIKASDPGPVERGTNLFYGGPTASTTDMYQDIDVSAAAAMIDSGQIQYDVSASLGGLAAHQTPTLTFTFFDWSGKQLAPASQLGPVGVSVTSLQLFSQSGALPAGSRRVHIDVSFHFGINGADIGGSLADNIAFVLIAPTGPPVISPGGIISASGFGAFPTLAQGTWVEIYGSDFAAALYNWSNADFTNGVGPTTLGGVTVSVGGKPAYIDFVSPTQVNALVPSNAPAGITPVTVTNASGTSDKFWAIVNPSEPGFLAPASFNIGGKQYIAALFPDGTYVLPAGAIAGVKSKGATSGDTIVLYGIGFGTVTPDTPAGQLASGTTSLSANVTVSINGQPATVLYDGLAPGFTGLYQFNVKVPSITAKGAVPLTLTLGNTSGTQTLYLAVNN